LIATDSGEMPLLDVRELTMRSAAAEAAAGADHG
jgi:hypothetical protein